MSDFGRKWLNFNIKCIIKKIHYFKYIKIVLDNSLLNIKIDLIKSIQKILIVSLKK